MLAALVSCGRVRLPPASARVWLHTSAGRCCTCHCSLTSCTCHCSKKGSVVRATELENARTFGMVPASCSGPVSEPKNRSPCGRGANAPRYPWGPTAGPTAGPPGARPMGWGSGPLGPPTCLDFSCPSSAWKVVEYVVVGYVQIHVGLKDVSPGPAAGLRDIARALE